MELVAGDHTSGLRFRLFGVPVAVHPSLPFVLALLGLSAGSVGRVAIWVGLGTFSVLLHEFGHAGASIAMGGRPRVVLAGLGGFTEPGITGQLGRSRTIALAFAGPAAGLALGGLVAGGLWWFGRPEVGSTADFAVIIALWVNIGWSLVNLLPVLPLDGGHILAELLPGAPEVRRQRAQVVSAAVGLVVAIAMFRYGLVFAGLMFGLLAMMSFRSMGSARAARDKADSAAQLASLVGRIDAGEDVEAELRELTGDADVGATSRSLLVEHLARTGRHGEARAMASNLGSGQPPTMIFLVDVLASEGAEGIDALVESFRRAPDALTARHLVIGLAGADRADEVVGTLRTVAAGPNRGPVLAGAQLTAHQMGQFRLSAAIGSLTYELEPQAGSLVAYNTACSLARAGDLDDAMAWLRAAVERGFDETRLLDHDADLAELRHRTAFTDLRAKVQNSH